MSILNNGEAAQPPQIQPGAMVQPGPLVTMVTAAISPDGKPYVNVRIECSAGMILLPMSPELAINFGKNLRTQGRAALSGLVIPAGAQMPDVEEDEDEDQQQPITVVETDEEPSDG